MDAILKYSAAEINEILAKLKAGGAATPSGDPMHYAYLTAGATWNASTGYWSLNGLTNITNDQMRAIYNLGAICALSWAPLSGAIAKVRTNIPRIGSSNTYARASENCSFLAYENNVIEVINFKNSYGTYEGVIAASSFSDAFNGCKALKTIYGILQPQTSTTFSNTFANCILLERVLIYQLLGNVSFQDSPALSKESLLYAIDKCASSKTFTITLHASVYAKCISGGEWHSDVQSALDNAKNNKSTTITLASA